MLTTIPDLERRCDALETWGRWAAGDTLDTNHLGAAVDILITGTGPNSNHYRALGRHVQQWAAGAGIDRLTLATAPSDVPDRRPRSRTLKPRTGVEAHCCRT